ncbi:replication initiation protein [Clostridium botulinum]|uniref:replication initiation protein n=1 Tax=Clostridium botulinum TaxID=1491 RepID=UPI000773906B|nr:replication initiation protein [Clostridium botulinum]MBY6932181.1 replication initiation protein [Clostridium botulinum]NFG21669.1 replication initiation protein [Clostridium botulinum]NFO82265.1 replication initiation protein [Clostridium botulinum]
MSSDISTIDEGEEINEVLFKSNTLIKSNVNITSVEYKIFNRILYKCQIEKDNNQQLRAVLTIDELSSIVKNKNENSIKSLTESLEKFIKIPIRFEKQKSYVITTLINKVIVDKDTLNFNCYLDKDLYEVLMGYKELGYSPINLKMIKQANGYYTQRFYELFRVWSGLNKEVTYTIDKLKEWLMITEGMSYDRYYNFKIKVVEPSLKEINKKLNMKVLYKENKVGRSVKSLTFTVEDLEPRQYDFNKDKFLKEQISTDEIALDLNISNNINIDLTESNKDELLLNNRKEFIDITEELNKSGIKIAISTINRFKTKYGEELVKKSVSILCNKVKQQKITAPVKYLKGILENLDKNTKDNEINNAKKLRFNNFEPREYDYDELERKLLGWDK